jgi:hypothetical protein
MGNRQYVYETGTGTGMGTGIDIDIDIDIDIVINLYSCLNFIKALTVLIHSGSE